MYERISSMMFIQQKIKDPYQLWRWPLLVTSGISGQERRQGLCPGDYEEERDRIVLANGLSAFGTV